MSYIYFLLFPQTLPEENFSLQNYLNEKNRVPTPPPQQQRQPEMSIEEEKEIPMDEPEQEEIEPEEIQINDIEREETPTDEIKKVSFPDQIETKEDEEVVPVTLPPSPPPRVIEQRPVPVEREKRESDKAPSVSSTMTLTQPSIRVEINGIMNPTPTATTPPKSRLERSSTRLTRSNKSSGSPRKTPITELRRYLLKPKSF